MNIVFDVDDTLFPSTEFTNLARRNALKCMVEKGLFLHIDDKYEDLEVLEQMLYGIIKEKGSNYPKHFDDLVKKLGIPNTEKFVAAGVYGYHVTKSLIRPYPDVPNMLYELSKSHELYIASSGVKIKQWDKLMRMNIDFFFKDVFITTDKNKDFYKKIKERIGSFVMIGDREDTDIVPAKGIAKRVIRIRREGGKYSVGPTIADYEIHNLYDLIKIKEIFNK